MVCLAISLCLLVNAVTYLDAETATRVIETPYGLIRGAIEIAPTGKELETYLGIPFAGPPLAEFRFKAPPPLKPWNGTLLATSQPPTCYQKKPPVAHAVPFLEDLIIRTAFSEDCLYLNIYVPKTEQPPGGFPVMVYIHGGGFSRGSVSFTSFVGSVLTTEENVILVAINYRLGALGFAYLNVTDVPGNAGLYDQLAALNWIHDCISAFGGDPGKVTVFGQSAGGSSVGYLYLTEAPFQRAILQSGGPSAYFAYQEPERMLSNTTQLVENVGCKSGDIAAVVRCLRKAEPMEIVLSEPQYDYDHVYTFQPTIDGKLVSKDPLESLREKRFPKRNVIVGTNKDEATIFLPAVQPFVFSLSDNIKVSKEEMREVLYGISPFTKTVQLAVSLMYEGGETDESTQNVLRVGSSILGDFIFSCPVLDLARFASEAKNRVFVYYFPHRSSVSQFPSWMGTTHGEELNYVFGKPLFPEKGFSPEEVAMSKRIMRYWANFARTGDPNEGVNVTEEIKWPLHTPQSRQYIVLAPNSNATGVNLKTKECEFWRDYRPLFEKVDRESAARSRCT